MPEVSHHPYLLLHHGLLPSLGSSGFGFCVLGQSLREGCGVNTIMFGSLIKGLCAFMQIGLAVKVFAKMPLMGCVPNLIIYSMLIEGICSTGDSRLGLELCRRMAREEVFLLSFSRQKDGSLVTNEAQVNFFR